MTTPEPSSPPQQLEYRSGIDERRNRPRMPILVQAILGTLISFTCIGLVLVISLIQTDGGRENIVTLLLLVVAAVGFAIALAVSLKKNAKTRGWSLGIWVGIALIVLYLGLCFLGFGG